MSDNIVPLKPTVTPDDIFETAKGRYKDAIVMGWSPEGALICISSDGMATAAEILLAIESVKFALLSDGIEYQ